MKFLRNTLSALVLAGAVFATPACTDDNTGSNEQNTLSISDDTMANVPQAPGEFAITRHINGEWFFNAIGQKGDIILMSEGYVQRVSALNGILSVEENGVHLDNYQISESAPGTWTYVLRAGNNQVIADSQEYRSYEDAQAGVVEARDLVAGILQYKAAVENGARFDLWRDKTDSEWHFALLADDGRILLESESYQGRTGAVNGIESVRVNGKDLNRYLVKDNGSGFFSFILKAANGQEIAESGATFASAEQADAEIAEAQQLLESERVGSPW